MKNITINGQEYKLVPVKAKKSPPVASKKVVEAKEEDVLGGYSVEEPEKEPQGVKKAVGKLSDYRERFKQRKISLKELIAPPNYRRTLPKHDKDLDSFHYKGEKLFFGEGIQREI